MNSTSFFSRLVSSAARSLGFSSTGPLVWRKLTPSSCAMMWLSVVLPRPGGPNSSTWSSASSRILAALIKISSCSRTLAWPTYSSSSLGRKARSMASSLGDAGAPDTMRLGGGAAKSSVWMLTVGGGAKGSLTIACSRARKLKCSCELVDKQTCTPFASRPLRAVSHG